MSGWAAAAVLVVGFLSGILSGMFGVGGAVLTTPGIRVLGATPLEAVGSTVPAILPGALSGAWRYSRSGLVNWRVGIVCGVAGAAFAVLGAWVADIVDAHWLMIATACLLGYSGVSTLMAGRRAGRSIPDPDVEQAVVHPFAADAPGDGSGAAAPDEPSAVDIPVGVLAVVGAGAGFLAGVLGVGGGIVMMPAFTTLLKIPIKVAVASSLVAVAIFSVPALVTHALLGHINWAFALLLVVGVVPGAQVGSHLTIGSSDRTVRIAFGAFLTVLAVVYGVGEIVALL